VEFKVGQHVWLNIQDFKLPNGLAPHYIAKYARPYEILHESHINVYTLKLPINFVAHPTFHVSKLKLFHVMNKDQTKSKECEQKWMPSNISLPPKLRAYFAQGKHALEARTT
jgi:hypothetical protein